MREGDENGGRVSKKRARNWDADYIHALRRHLKLTQQQMAQEMGTRQQTISEWETGLYQPRGTSSTLLNIIAERASFPYRTSRDEPTAPEAENGPSEDQG
jgi:DNA-binding transcriptional regulator YiaG